MASFVSCSVIVISIVIAYYAFLRTNFDPESIRGKRVLVTGTSSGIGEHVAYRYAELGAKLVITARRADLLEKVAAKCRRLGAETVKSVIADMANPEDRVKLAKETKKTLGGLDILILNHGWIGYDWWTGAPDNLTTLQQMMNVNFYSFVDLTGLLVKPLKQSRGRIGVVSSMSGKIGNTGLTHYASTKFAIQGFYTSLRQELNFQKSGVTVTIAAYGPVATEKAIISASKADARDEFLGMAGPIDEAADVLVRAVSAGVYEFTFPKVINLLLFANGLFPSYVEDGMSWFQNSGKVH